MRTNVVIDDQLMREAIEASGLPTKRAVIEEALRTFIKACAARDLIALGGQVEWYDEEEVTSDAWDVAELRGRAGGG